MPPTRNPDNWLTRVCLHCGKSFEVRKIYAERVGKNRGRCCSLSCSYYIRLADKDDILGKQVRTGVKPVFEYSWNIDSFGYKRFNRGVHKNKRVHRVVAEKKILGRSLLSTEIVHHINLDKLDNRRCNLLICSQSEHMKIHRRLEVVCDS